MKSLRISCQLFLYHTTSLTQSVSNSEKRAIGSNGGFGYRSLKEGVEIALLDSVILAYWKCTETKERKKQIARY